MTLSFNKRYTDKTASDKRQDIYGRMDDDLEGTARNEYFENLEQEI